MKAGRQTYPRRKPQAVGELRAADAQIFITVAASHTLSAAAASLGLQLHTVSRCLKRLESLAKVALIRRSREGLYLSETGHRLLAACYRILEAQRDAEEALCAEPEELEGTLHVRAPMMFARSVLSSILPRFQSIHPNLKVEIALYCSDWDQEPTAEHDIYLKVRSPRDTRRHLRVFPAIRQGLFCSPEFLTSCNAEPKHPGDLAKMACLGYESLLEGWTFSRASEQITIRPYCRVAASDPDVLEQLAVAGVGITVLPLWLADANLANGQLIRLLPQWELDPIVFCALFQGRLRPESKEHAFLEQLKSILGTAQDPRCSGKDPKRFFVLESEPAPTH